MKLEALSSNSPQKHSSFENSKIPSSSDTFKTVDSLIDELKSKYNHLNFTFLSFANQSELKDYASASSGTNNVIIALELLDKMLADTSVYNKVTGILDNFSKYKENAQFETLLSGKTLTSMKMPIYPHGQHPQKIVNNFLMFHLPRKILMDLTFHIMRQRKTHPIKHLTNILIALI